MKKKYKALIVDVDGTLLINKRDGMPSKKVTEAMDKASKLLHVGLATSRCIPNVSHVIDYLRLSGPSILQGGAYIFDAEKKTTISEYILQEKQLKALWRIIKDIAIPFVYCDNKTKHAPFITGEHSSEKVFMVFSQGVDPKITNELTLQLSQIPGVAVHTTPSWTKGKNDILVTHSLATKQHGILEVAKILGIETHEIIGIGDGGNDFPLLMACGLKVAMGNAVDDLKAIADYIAPSVENDGVADVIERFIL